MLTKLQFNILFYVGVGGVVVILFGPSLGLAINPSPVVVTGIGGMLTFVLTQKKAIIKSEKDKNPPEEQSHDSSGIEDQSNAPG